MPLRKTGLAPFIGRQQTESRGHEAALEDIRTKARGDTAAATLRLNPNRWERVHRLARSEGVSLNRLALLALSKIFQEKGLLGL